jgi:hypothetical protein
MKRRAWRNGEKIEMLNYFGYLDGTVFERIDRFSKPVSPNLFRLEYAPEDDPEATKEMPWTWRRMRDGKIYGWPNYKTKEKFEYDYRKI